MVRKYSFGNPFPTDAVIKHYPAEQDSLPYFAIKEGSLYYPLPAGLMPCIWLRGTGTGH